jgi:hypothetical protein
MYSKCLCTLLRRVHKLVEYINGMGAGREGYTNLWSTLMGWELEEKGTQTYIKGMGAGKEGYTNLWRCTLLLQLPSF